MMYVIRGRINEKIFSFIMTLDEMHQFLLSTQKYEIDASENTIITDFLEKLKSSYDCEFSVVEAKEIMWDEIGPTIVKQITGGIGSIF